MTAPAPGRLHRLVPASVRTRLGRRRALILGSARLVAGAHRLGGLALVFRVAEPRTLPILMRAARAHDAVLGLGPADGDGRTQGRFFEAVADAAAATGHVRPLFLAAPPLSLSHPDVEAQAYDRMEAGYTHLVLAVGRPDGDTVDAVVRASRVARERGAGVELRLEAGVGEQERLILDALGGVGHTPDTVTLPWGRRPDGLPAWGWVGEGEGHAAGVQEARRAGAWMVSVRTPPGRDPRLDEPEEARIFYSVEELIRLAGLPGSARRLDAESEA